MKIHPVGGELLHAGGRMDAQTKMTTLIVAYHGFAEAPKSRHIDCVYITNYLHFFTAFLSF
jgi:hypothetical protein